jgi:MarR family 2-MHQ and catechol resistance regulon transcriptional repressor
MRGAHAAYGGQQEDQATGQADEVSGDVHEPAIGRGREILSANLDNWTSVGSRAPSATVRPSRHHVRAMTLVPGDPLAHRALDSLLRAEASVRRRLSTDLEREGLSASGFSVLVVLTTAGGQMELRTLRRRLQTSKANATEVVTTLEHRGLVVRSRLAHDRRAATVALTGLGQELVDRLFPEHTARVQSAFAVLDEAEKRSLAEICRKLATEVSPRAA